ncbi:MAG: Mov34/MPN/PAD-1 family protein [candidate division WOR-3 bacterium]
MAKEDLIECFINPPAFTAIVTSVVEVYAKETIGFLVGVRGENKFIIEYAIPYQTADVGYTHAEVDWKRAERVNEVLKLVGEGLEFIGDFHSHTQFGQSLADIKPSPTDLISTKEGEIYLIIAVNRRKRAQPWREHPDRTISGTIRDYHIKIGGYTVIKMGFKSYRKVKIRCPAVTGLTCKDNVKQR